MLASGGVARALLWLASAALLLVIGFGAVVFGIYGLARVLGSVDAENLKAFQIMLPFYFKLVCFRGLMPCMVLTLAFWPGVVRLLPGVVEKRGRLLAGLVLAALPAYAIVGPLLLNADFEGGASLRMRSVVDHLATATGIVAGAAFTAWVPRAFLPALWRGGRQTVGQ